MVGDTTASETGAEGGDVIALEKKTNGENIEDAVTLQSTQNRPWA